MRDVYDEMDANIAGINMKALTGAVKKAGLPVTESVAPDYEADGHIIINKDIHIQVGIDGSFGVVCKVEGCFEFGPIIPTIEGAISKAQEML